MDILIDNVHLATMTGERPYGAVEGGALAIDDGRIAWIGDGPRPGAERRIDAGGRWMTPALIDCHTHLVYGGQRAAEFEQRLGGRSYADIAGGGGGILSTVRATRAVDEEQLLAAAVRRAGAMLGQGVTVVEIKSGYGLERDSELRMLRVATRLGQSLPITVRRTFLGAHALPPEFAGDGDGYIASVCDDMLPAAVDAGLVDAVDAFCETIAFSAGQTRRVFERARSLGLPVKLHADQLSDSGGAALAASFGALSADHIEYTGEDGVRAMAMAGTVAVLLPGAFYYLSETRLPPVERLREHGVPMAVASDCNPGSSPTTSLLLMLNMACTLFRLTPEEALAGVTRNAARALGLDASHGTLSVGKTADFVLWDIDNPAELAYTIGMNPCHQVWRGGRIVHEAAP